jgi:hypothetical protein
MRIISKANIDSFFQRVYAKISFTLVPIYKDGEEILNSRQVWEALDYALNNREYITTELSKPNSVGVMFKKEDTQLGRCFVTVPNADGIVELVIVTNQKLATDKKSKKIGLLGSGNQKDVKYGVRVDTRIAEPRAIMKIELCPLNASAEMLANANNTLKQLIIEAERPYKYDSPNIVKSFMGPQYVHSIPVDDFGLKARIANYGKRERAALPREVYKAVLMIAPFYGHKLTNLYKNILTESEKLQIAEEKNNWEIPAILMKLIKDILHGFSAIHVVGDLHGDPGSDNILVARNPEDGTLSAAIIDFGLASNSDAQRTEISGIGLIIFELLRDDPDLETLSAQGINDISNVEQAFLKMKYPFLKKFDMEQTEMCSARQLLDELNQLDAAKHRSPGLSYTPG